MTDLDKIMLAFAVVQVLGIVLMVGTALGMLETLKRARRITQPALNEAKSVVSTGKAVIDRARIDGLATVNRVKVVSRTVKRRVQTTARIARELKPNAEAAVAEIREQQRAATEAKQHLGEIARGLGRVRAAVESARRAARDS